MDSGYLIKQGATSLFQKEHGDISFYRTVFYLMRGVMTVPPEKKYRGTHRVPRTRAVLSEVSKGYGKAHAHLTAHEPTHHAVEACLTHKVLRS